MTPEEAKEAIDLTIQSLPESLKNSNDFKLLVSKKIANALLMYINILSGHPMSGKICFESGEYFKWRGVNCKVA